MYSSVNKYLSGSIFLHVGVVASMAFSSVLVTDKPLQEIKLSQMTQMKAVSQEEIISSISVSEKELQKALEEYDNLEAMHVAQLERKKEEMNKASSKIMKKEQEIKKQNKELNELASDIKKMEELKSQLREEEIKKKKQEQQRINKEKERKDKLEAETQRQQARKEQLEKQKIANEKALKEIAERNLKAEEREIARIRGMYETEIHKLLYNAWTLPYDRKDVHCSVELALSKNGSIESFSFLTECPSNYKTMIDLAVERITHLPKVSPKIFQTKEVVNFIDRIK